MARRAIVLVITASMLCACERERELSPEAQRLYDEELAKIRGEGLTTTHADRVTLAAYEGLAIGGTYADAVAILGDGTEAARSQIGPNTFVTYNWIRPDGGNISLTYHNGLLATKAQAGLR